jgi:hypothetical protein
MWWARPVPAARGHFAAKAHPTTASYEWATRLPVVSLPCQAVTKATGSIVEDGRLRSEPLSLPTPTRSGAQAGTAGSITVTNHLTASELQPTLGLGNRADGDEGVVSSSHPYVEGPGPSWGRNSAAPGGQQRTTRDSKRRGQRPFGAIDLGRETAGLGFHTAEAKDRCVQVAARRDPCADGRSQSDDWVGCMVWSITASSSADSVSRSISSRRRALNASTVLAAS